MVSGGQEAWAPGEGRGDGGVPMATGGGGQDAGALLQLLGRGWGW